MQMKCVHKVSFALSLTPVKRAGGKIKKSEGEFVGVGGGQGQKGKQQKQQVC